MPPNQRSTPVPLKSCVLFILQLAADAGNAIAMTDDEKKRIEDLLGDLDALPEIPEEESVLSVTGVSIH